MGDTMRDGFEEEVCRHFDPERANFYLVRDEQSGRYHEWGVMLAWECYRAAHEAGRQQGPSDDMKQAIVTTVNDAVDAAFERGRQLGMEQVRHELAKSSQEIEAKPVFWAASWALDDLDKVFAYGNDVPIRIWRSPADKAGLSPLYTTPPAGDSDTQS